MYVGALHADTYGADSGDAFIYRFDNGTWSLESQLLAPGIAAGDWFGWDGDIDGDCAVVGAGEPWSGPGYAWTFRRFGTTWVPEQRLTGTGTGINDQFGATLDLDGDRLIINSLVGPIGGAYVFERGPSGWSEVALLVPPGPAGGDSVAGVAISGGVALVASRYDDELGSQAGAVCVYRRHPSGWEFEQKLFASNGSSGDWLGFHSLSTDGNRIIAGSRYNDVAGLDSGSAYVFDWTGANWMETAMLQGSDTGPGDQCGYGVWIQGPWAIVGAATADPEGVATGQAYLFEQVEGAWVERKKFTPNDGESGDLFSGVTRSDGQRVVLSSFMKDNSEGFDAGSVYVAPLSASGNTTVDLVGSPTTGKVPLTVTFHDLSVGPATSWRWDFGNGYFSMVRNPVFTFNEVGSFNVTLTVATPCGEVSRTYAGYVTVLPRHPQVKQSGPP